MMEETWNKLDRDSAPTTAMMADYAANPLWQELCRHVEETYGAKTVLEYSGCSVPGWNLKYRKSGRGLCTLYPFRGHFVALVVIGEREKPEFDLMLPALTPYTQELYRRTKDKKGLCWLMFEVRDRPVLEDAMRCIALRMPPQRKRA